MSDKRIVVGVDGSAGSEAALRWAVSEAQLRGCVVEAVHSWTYPYVGEAAGMAALSIGAADLEEVAHAALTATIDTVTSSGGSPEEVLVEGRVERGDAAAVLLRVAADAELLVVGSRGHGGFAGLLLGSVSQQVVHHAPCPVVVVPSR
jgi:nucleotide-binding universal stress UspA family protein